MELKLEKDRQQEVSDIAQEQVRNLELWKLSQEYQLDYMRRQILELQSTSDERSIIGKNSHYCSSKSVGHQSYASSCGFPVPGISRKYNVCVYE